MKLLSTPTDRHVVHDDVAAAVLENVLTLIRTGRTEIITVPVEQDGRAGTVDVLITAATQLSVRATDADQVELSPEGHELIVLLRARTAVVISLDEGVAPTAFTDDDLFEDPTFE